MQKIIIPRILIGPVEVSGYYRNLSAGIEHLGYECDYVTYGSHIFEYGGETIRPRLLQLAGWFNKRRSNFKNVFLLKLLIVLPREFFQFCWACLAIFKYNVFIFSFGESLLRFNIDLVILKLLKKTVIMNMGHGSELRPPVIDGFLQSKDGCHHPSISSIALRTKTLFKRIRRIEKYASYIIGAPFSSTQFAKKKLINIFALGLPCQDPQINGAQNTSKCIDNFDSLLNPQEKPIRILHSPSHEAGKGTFEIRNAIKNLKLKGYFVELIEISGRPNDEVIAELLVCDFVVDQMYSDTPMASFAAEAAWFGKPAVVGGYQLEYVKKFFQPGMLPPSYNCLPDQIEYAIEVMIVNNELRLNLGKDAQEFVKSLWDVGSVANRYLKLINGEIPNQWWLDPSSVIYLQGCGQRDDKTKENIRALVKNYGVDSLKVSHHPNLEKAMLDFAGISNR